jgi:hypothetical protein
VILRNQVRHHAISFEAVQAESPDAPHMVDGIYYGRSETGKVKLTDAEVERLILFRGRANQRLQAAMADTSAADPEPGTEASHFYFTAVPTQGLPDMLLGYTRDPRAHSSFMTTATHWRNAIAREDGNQRGNPAKPIAFDQMAEARRGQKPRGAWFFNYPRNPPELRLGTIRRTLGLDDDGTVRFIDMAAGSLPDGLHPAVSERMAMGHRGHSLPDNSVGCPSWSGTTTTPANAARERHAAAGHGTAAIAETGLIRVTHS